MWKFLGTEDEPIRQVVQRYVKEPKDFNQIRAELREQLHGHLAAFAKPLHERTERFVKEAGRVPVDYCDEYHKEKRTTTCWFDLVELTLDIAKDKENFNLWYFHGGHSFVTFRMSSRQGQNLSLAVRYCEGKDLVGLFERYKVLDSGADYAIVQGKYDIRLVHFYKPRKDLAVIYEFDRSDDIGRVYATRLRDYLHGQPAARWRR